jgi:hypothetical protein
MDWTYTTLPNLGINRNITRDWRWLPQTYQGLKIPNVGLLKCSDMIGYFVENGKRERALALDSGDRSNSHKLRQDLTGISRQMDQLATCSWMTLLWHYLWYYGVKMLLDNARISFPREQD